VKEDSALDREAYDRATSVYLVDRTIPMLPERLCNFICSLRPNEEKLAYSAIFEMNERAEILQFHIAKTVIESNRRFTYEEAQALIERNGQASADDLALPGDHPAVDGSAEHPVGEWAAEILLLDRLAKQLRARRFKAGSIGFDRPEVRFDIDEKGHPVSTYVKIAKDANKLVEEFMLLANRSVAEHVAVVPKGKQPKVLPYRIHDVPDPEKLEKLRGFVAKFGYKVRTEGTKTDISHSLNDLLGEVKGKKEENVVELVALRAMMKARYSVHNIGHYGLMFRHYTHFTSPIRRYPDLMVHRLLAKYAEGGRSVSAKKYEEMCEHCSEREQVAATAERASIKYKQAEFMADRIGQEFDGVISGVTEFGIYVEDILTKCEGMVPLRDLSSDYYEFDEDNYRLVGRRTKRIYNLGDKVRFRVERANLERRQLDFSLVEDEGYIAPVPKKGQRPSSRHAAEHTGAPGPETFGRKKANKKAPAAKKNKKNNAKKKGGGKKRK
jgi:ribonuclease R